MNPLDISRSIAGNEFLQVIAIRAILSEVHMIEEPFYPAVGADAVRVLLTVVDRPAHPWMPAAAEQHRHNGAHPGHCKSKWPKPP